MILCIGTTPTVQRTMIFPQLLRDEVNRATHVHDYASGKAINVARVLGVLGKAALTVGFSGGRRGDFVLEELARENIASDFVAVSAQTRLCTTLIDQASGAVTELVEEAPPATALEWNQLSARIDLHAGSARMLVFSGTTAPGAPPDWPMRWLNGQHTVLIDAKGEPMRRALASKGVVIAKLNRAEFEQTVGERFLNDASFEHAVRSAAPANGALIVTTGKTGAVASMAGEFFRISAPEIQAVSPIGSGDAFAAGLAAEWDQGFLHALRLACACGVANALTSDSGHLHLADVERLRGQVQIELV